MADSRMNSGLIRAAGGAPSTLAQAGAVPLRVVVRNLELVINNTRILALAFDDATLQNADASLRANVYRLPPETSDIFVLQPGQLLYAISTDVVTISATWAISEVLPKALGSRG